MQQEVDHSVTVIPESTKPENKPRELSSIFAKQKIPLLSKTENTSAKKYRQAVN